MTGKMARPSGDMAARLVPLFVCFCSCFVFVSGSLILRQNVLTVKVGRTVYLNKDDLVFSPGDDGDEGCRVEVVQNDPITQRVGKLEPKIFDCTFQANTVRYIHSGSPFLSEDRVKFRVHRFTNRETFTETFYLNIKITNATAHIVIRRHKNVIVSEFNGVSNAIDATVIGFRHSQSPNVSCTVSFNKWDSHWPLVGHIVMGDQHNPVEGLKKSCQEFLFMELRYEHLQKPTPDVDYLPISIELFNPGASDEVMTERYFLPIYIKNALLNSPPRSSFMSMYMMDVDQFVLSTIIPGIISAEDYETPNSLLVYNISKPTGPDQGYFVSIDDHTTEITSFLQDDLENHRIAYQPPTTSFIERRIYEVEFQVFDSHFADSMPIVLHIAVRPSSTNNPRVSFNTGLVLLEGQSREINSDIIQVRDNDNINDVRMYVTGGLDHGQFLVNNNIAMYFSVADLSYGRVKYVHDDSESTKDKINLKISDGSSNVIVTLPITIIPKDDNPPYIINNIGMELSEGQTKRIESALLFAHDTDSVDLNIVYVIAKPTQAGEIIRRLRPMDTGTRVNRFTQREITKGQIYYRHFGHEKFRDEFEFTLRDQQDPPNESSLETFVITVNPVNENPPQLSPDATRLMHVSETDIALITKTELEYTDTETQPDRLTYIITTPPFYVYKNRGGSREDAGRIIAMHNLTMINKDDRIPAVETFRQEDINHLKIGFMPPIGDIGAEPRLVRFVYMVQDSSGNKVLGQQFDIDVQPVNDKAPQFVTSKLLVEEGGVLGISVIQISAVDPDTNEYELVFILEDCPKHGRLQKSGVNLNEKDTFNVLDLRKKDLRYIHDGSEVLTDSFSLSVYDGNNRVSKVFNIEIVPIDDEALRVQDNLRANLIVSEGSIAVISPAVLAATDEDTDDEKLVFLIVKQPKYGIIQLDGEPAPKFTQQHVKDGLVRYIHSSGEIGSSSVKDSVTFIVSDQHFKATADPPRLNLHITITPVDNQKPTIIAGVPMVVKEGEKFVFAPDVITAKDPDTEPESIQFFITQQPQWGFIENTKPREGSERSRAGKPITTFKLQDIIDGSINYVQATHKGVEPTLDTFQFYATDGKHNSNSHVARITIDPVNDEEPDVMLNDIVVDEGGGVIIDQSTIDAFDNDVPRQDLKIDISQPPEYGDIVVLLHSPNGDVEAAVSDFSADEIHNGMQLKYRHDGSENFVDKFAITVSDGKHEVKKVCSVTILPVNDEIPEVTKNAGLHIDYGKHAALSSVVLQSVDRDNTDAEIFYIIVAVPTKGILQYCENISVPTFSQDCTEILVGQNFTQSQINDNNIRYIHTTGMGDSEFDSFMFVLTDGKNKRHVGTFQIRILNSKRSTIALLNKGLDVKEGNRIPITTEHLSATDESTDAESIVFAVINPPMLGYLEYADTALVPINSFTQLDLASQKIFYNHLTKADFKEDSFTFTVTNGISDTQEAEFKFRVEPIDKELPTLAVTSLVEVIQNSEITLTPTHLRADDPDTDSRSVTYTIKKQPTHGRLYNRGMIVTNLFTQSAIDRGFITYENDGSYTGLDNFLFSLSDGQHEGFLINGTFQTQPATCSIFIKPLVNDAPKLLTMVHPDMLEKFPDDRYGFELNSRVLKAVDSDTTNSNLVYVIEQRPRNGHIENSAAKRYVRRRFTQRDLDENTLRFIIDLKARETSDSFSFRIQDNRGNSLKNQKMDLEWSLIELSKNAMIVCENVGTLSVALTRTGKLASSAFVSIEARDRSTTQGEDYTPSGARQVQFDPGQSKATWDVHITEDRLLEGTENFNIYISDPVNAILGRKHKLQIRVINAVGGECPQYIGMIDKHPAGPPDSISIPIGEGDADLNVRKVDHKFKKLSIKRKNPFENTYNTDPGEAAVGLPKSESLVVTPTKNPDGRRKRKKDGKRRKKNKKRNKRKRKRSKGRKSKKPEQDMAAIEEIAQNQRLSENVNPPLEESVVETRVYGNDEIKAPQDCTIATNRLLYFDTITEKMYICNGQAWEVWSQDQTLNKDQQPETRECQQGWSKYENRCFKFINERLTWEVAETLCQMSYGGHLTAVASSDHLDWLSELSGQKAYWIGLNDKEDDGRWTYTNGGEAVFTNWSQNKQPRIKRMLNKKKCVIVDKRRRWKIKICDKRKSRLICELDIGAGEIDRAPPKREISSSRRSRRRGRYKDHQNDDTKHRNNGRSKRTRIDKGFFFGN